MSHGKSIPTIEKYQPEKIEKKWQQKWAEDKIYASDLSKSPKNYVLAEFAYPSGDLHMGHWFTWSGADIYARLKRMQGYQVFFPNGFDAFGLPAENAAIKRGIHPQDWTRDNIAKMKQQYSSMGASFTFDHEVITCTPQYYGWNQWIFLKMYEKGLAYRGTQLSNWCPHCQTVLANEGVVDGRCWRCDTEVVQKEIEQWFFKITEYADRLLWPKEQSSVLSYQLSDVGLSVVSQSVSDKRKTGKLDSENRKPKTDNRIDPTKSGMVDWPTSVKEAQNNWIGRSEGAIIKFQISPLRPTFTEVSVGKQGSAGQANSQFQIEVFTTRPDTLYGATFLVVAPEHPFIASLLRSNSKDQNSTLRDLGDYVALARKKDEVERKEEKEKSGVFTGSYATHPITGEKLPIWVADYVLMGYGTGAIMAVPGHDRRDFEFAKKYNLGIKQVVRSEKQAVQSAKRKAESEKQLEEAYAGEGIVVNSGEWNGWKTPAQMPQIIEWLEKQKIGKKKVQYHLHDWSISRQRYWGTPIPIIYCANCATKTGADVRMIDGAAHAVIPVPEKDLPVILPYDVDYAPKGKAPLASNSEWLAVACPKCGEPAHRDADTMDTFVDSSWYFFRYSDPHNQKEPFDRDKASQVMPVDTYFGGAEHTLGHTLYSRFFTKFFKDLGLTNLEEYALRRVSHGIILGPDNNKMSKSKGNVVNPDDEVKQFGADAVRVYLAFFIPYEGTGPWISDHVWAAYRFLQRVWQLQQKIQGEDKKPSTQDLHMLNKTIQKVSEHIEEIRFNTAVAAIMEWLNYLSAKEKLSRIEFLTLLKLLAPFAPHITEELYQRLRRSQNKTELNKVEPYGLGNFQSIHVSSWPEVEEKYLVSDTVTIAVQVNGKLRETITIHASQIQDKTIVEQQARKTDKIKPYLDGFVIKKVVYVPGKILNFVTE